MYITAKLSLYTYLLNAFCIDRAPGLLYGNRARPDNNMLTRTVEIHTYINIASSPLREKKATRNSTSPIPSLLVL